MKCHQCDAENPKTSKFCNRCGTPLGVLLHCAECGHDNAKDSLFCTECGEKLGTGQPSKKRGNQRKCRHCGQFNELETLFCVSCGEEIIPPAKGKPQRSSASPSYKAIALVIGAVFILGVFVKLGTTMFQGGDSEQQSPTPIPASTSSVKVDEAQVVAVAKNFKCACGGCGELPLATCECDMPRGAVEEKNFIREKLAEGLSVLQVIELVDKKYGHRV